MYVPCWARICDCVFAFSVYYFINFPNYLFIYWYLNCVNDIFLIILFFMLFTAKCTVWSKAFCLIMVIPDCLPDFLALFPIVMEWLLVILLDVRPIILKGFGDLGHLPLSNSCRTTFGICCFRFLSNMNLVSSSFETSWHLKVWKGWIDLAENQFSFYSIWLILIFFPFVLFFLILFRFFVIIIIFFFRFVLLCFVLFVLFVCTKECL